MGRRWAEGGGGGIITEEEFAHWLETTCEMRSIREIIPHLILRQKSTITFSIHAANNESDSSAILTELPTRTLLPFSVVRPTLTRTEIVPVEFNSLYKFKNPAIIAAPC